MPRLVARAWSPGHVTGFFAIRDSATNPLARGSIGAGFSISLGVRAELSATAASERWSPGRGVEVRVAGRKAALRSLDVTRSVLAAFASAVPDSMRRHALRIAFDHELPVGQGFGVSGAAALSLSLALADIYDLPHRFAHEVAHIAEVASKTGLGDVAGQIAGGFEARLRPGLPPRGRVIDLGLSGPVVLVSLGPKLSTKSVLEDLRARRRVNAVGARALREFMKRPSQGSFARVSAEFARRAGLATPEVTKLAATLEGIAPAAQVMLGRSLFALPSEGGVSEVLRRLPPSAPRWVARVSEKGCGLLGRVG